MKVSYMAPVEPPPSFIDGTAITVTILIVVLIICGEKHAGKVAVILPVYSVLTILSPELKIQEYLKSLLNLNTMVLITEIRNMLYWLYTVKLQQYIKIHI